MKRPSKFARMQCSTGGFTLIELLLVLGMLVALAALAAPSFQGMLTIRRLESGADQLRTVLRQARREAIEHGVAYRIDLLPETGKLWLRPSADPLPSEEASSSDRESDLRENEASDSADVPKSDRSEAQATTSGATALGGANEREPLPLVREQTELPPGIRIIPSDRVEDWLSARNEDEGTSFAVSATPATSAGEDVADPVSLQAEGEGWMPWFEFFPDGSARQSAVLLVDDAHRFIEAVVDEMTGDVEVSPMRSIDELDEDVEVEGVE